MKCKQVTFVVLLFNLSLSYGSIVQLNETMLLSLPPLYSLDEWSRCQDPGDHYCVVDAVLHSLEDTKMVTFLQEYSKQTEKHYNRTQIHRGLCLNRCSSMLNLTSNGQRNQLEIAQQCINQSIWSGYGIQATVTSVRWCQEAHANKVTYGSRALGAFTLFIAALTLLSTGLHLLGDKCNRGQGNRYLLAFSLKRNWSILTYSRAESGDSRMRNLACLEGIRFIAIECVILSHVLFMYVYSYTDNPHYIEQMYDNFGWQILFNSPLWLQAFFSLSSFLTTYSLLVHCQEKKFTIPQALMSVITRWIRLTPAAVFALWFTIWWYPLLGNGAQWGWLVQRESEDCSTRWWYHVLYVHNHIPLGKMCMGHTWYLAADMQLHIFGVMLLLIILRWRKTVSVLLGGLLIGSMIAAGVVTYVADLRPIITAQAPELLRTLFSGSKIMSLLYLPSYMNLPGYICGIVTAFVYHSNENQGVKLHENKMFSLVFHMSLHVGGCVVMLGTMFLRDGPPAQWGAALYASLDRTLVAVLFNVFMLGCISRCKSTMSSMLEWRGVHVFGRLSYCAFLIHFSIIRLMVAAESRLVHVSLVNCVSLFITATIYTYMAAIPLCLLIEMPATQLWKAFLDKDRSQDCSSQDHMKTLDLVSVNRETN